MLKNTSDNNRVKLITETTDRLSKVFATHDWDGIYSAMLSLASQSNDLPGREAAKQLETVLLQIFDALTSTDQPAARRERLLDILTLVLRKFCSPETLIPH